MRGLFLFPVEVANLNISRSYQNILLVWRCDSSNWESNGKNY